jgi:murein L,D-transpeptidase YcbB/YkuD
VNAVIRPTKKFIAILMLIPMLMALSLPAQAGAVDDAIKAKLAPLAAQKPLHATGKTIPRAEVEFYAQRQWQPVWDDSRYQALLTALDDTYTDGLDPEDYSVSRLRDLPRDNNSPAQAAERDILATRAYLLALEHLIHGKVDPRTLDSQWNFSARQFDPEHGLVLAREAVEKNDIAGIFNRARPDAPQYNKLRAALANLRAIAQSGGWTTVPAADSALKPGDSSARVPPLRQRMRQAGLLPDGAVAKPEVYDPALVDAVKRFQTEAYLDADGVVGASTVAAMNVPVQRRIEQARINLERARWLLHELKGNLVIVDIAGYRIAYIHDGEVKWRSRVQIGKEYRSTPVFKSAINRITLSPGWVVPSGILRKDTLPAIRRDPNYLTRNNISVYDSAGQKVAPSSVDWSKPGNITLRQTPSANGSLGEIAIRFPNSYSVYLHDTPHKALFAQTRRATSSGCIRVENIHDLAVLLLDDPVNWNREAMQKVIDERKTREVPLKNPVPILLAYWTMDVDDDGYISFKPDVYKRDDRVLAALGKAL